jgi:hypothetical protein
MRYYDDMKCYHFSTSPTTDDAERALIIQESFEYARDMVTDTFKPEDSMAKNILKYSVPAVFFAAVIAMIICSVMGKPGLILYIFGGIFVLFGIVAAFPAKTEIRERPGQAKLPRGVGSFICIAIGLAVILPTALAPKIGYAKAFVTTGAWFFLLGGLFLAAVTIIGVVRNNRASKNPVSARCIGYVKTASGSDNNMGHYHTIVCVAPVFEYYYEGQMYQAFQEDDLTNLKRQIQVGETVELGVDERDPYHICYRKNIGAKIVQLVMCLIAIAAGIFLFVMLPTVNDSQGFKVETMGGEVALAKAQFDDKMIEDNLGTDDFTIEYAEVEKVYEEDGMWFIDLSNGERSRIGDDDSDKYEEGAGLYLVIPSNGGGGINFAADDWEYSGSRTVVGAPE